MAIGGAARRNEADTLGNEGEAPAQTGSGETDAFQYDAAGRLKQLVDGNQRGLQQFYSNVVEFRATRRGCARLVAVELSLLCGPRLLALSEAVAVSTDVHCKV